MNPAALKAELDVLEPGGTLIVNIDAFDERNLAKAGYDVEPARGRHAQGLPVYEVPMTTHHQGGVADARGQAPGRRAVEELLRPRAVSWMYTRPERAHPRLDQHQVRGTEPGRRRQQRGVQGRPRLRRDRRAVRPPLRGPAGAAQAPGTYTNITGNTALAWGLIAAGQLAKLPVFLGSYPITPASDILHELSKHKNFGVRTLQAEDEIAGHRPAPSAPPTAATSASPPPAAPASR